MPPLSRTLERFQPSPIAAIFSLAVRLTEEGRDIVNLSTGEPDFPTPDPVCRAAKEAIDAGVTKYTPIDGTSELKEAIRRKFRQENGLDFAIDQVIVDAGAKPLLAHVMLALLDAGDEVIIPTPCWSSHPGAVRLCGAHPVFLPCGEDQGFKLAAADLGAAITPQTKMLILNSPGNPTGAVYGAEELEALAVVLRAHPDLWVVSDDIYEHLVFDGKKFATLAAVAPDLQDQIITVNGVSKGYAMTGWRIGYAGGPKAAIAGVRKIMTQAAGNPCSISQKAAVAALTGPQEHLRERCERYQARRDYVVRALNQAPGLSVKPSQGAFYLFINCAGVLGQQTPEGRLLDSSGDFVTYLLDSHGVAVVPGAAFESDPFFRLSFAAADQALAEGCKRIVAACSALS